MGSMEGGQTPIVEMKKQHSPESGEQRRSLNSELWHTCAGPLVSLPQVGSLAYYFPQGHCQQVAASSRNMTANSQIPNYPNLPCQLLCQVQNVTLHADNETDEIFAKMSLQPLDSETDVFSISEIGPRPSKHPGVFFCKTLTASDTSTHGGFSVPRRAAERIFPPLDYTIKPPTQELVVRDLHDNTWTFRHIYRGQPKRHLLTTGWSLFVSTKRLKAGDSVLFIRDEKSQLLVGVRRGSRQQTTLPSSLLSADSMHIGVLAAAAHAAANRSPFTIFYNPRACPSEFVIPLAKYKRAVYGTQLSTGLRFSMMFETEESCKRRYMGTIVGISDLDPLRWPGSKWQNIQVKWDEPGCSDKQKRVSSWEVETLETLPIFPSLTSSLKRPLQSAFLDNGWSTLLHWPAMRVPENGTLECSNTMRNLYPKQVKTLMKPQLVDNNGTCLWVTQQEFAPKRGHFEEVKTTMPMDNQNVHHASSVSILQEGLHVQTDPGQYTAFNLHSSFKSDQPENLHPPEKTDNSMSSETVTEKLKLEPEVLSDHIFDFTILEGCNIEKLDTNPVNPQCLAGQLTFLNQNQSPSPSVLGIPQSDSAIVNGLLPQLDTDEWMVHSSCQPLAGENTFTEPLSGLQEQSVAFSQEVNLPLSSVNQDMWDPHVKNLISEQGQSNLNCMTASDTLRDLLAESNNQSEIWDNASADINSVSPSMVDPCTSSAIVDEFCTLKDGDFQNPSGCMVSSFSMSQDVQSQITSASLASSSHVDFDGSSFLQNNSWLAVQPPRKRTYTKVQKAGSVGRSIDVTTFKNYEELIHAIECMFGLKGLLNDSRGSGWKLVYLDYENDVLLVGDDPWGEFVGCVRCIRILSPTEVQQMSEEGMKLLNSGALKGITGRMSEGCT